MAAGEASTGCLRALPPLPPLLLSLLLLLLLLLPPPGRADGRHCVRRGGDATERGQLRTELLVDGDCGCEQLALFVQLNSRGMPVDCRQNGTWHDTKQRVPVAGGAARVRTVVAACFEARCTCANGSDCRQRWRFDGLEYPAYNLVISAEQTSDRPPQLKVHARPAVAAARFYFPRLAFDLYRCANNERVRAVDALCGGGGDCAAGVVGEVSAAAAVRVRLRGAPEPLAAGCYRLEVRPAGSWVCQGSNNGCRRLQLNVTLHAAPGAVGAPLPAAGAGRMKALYAVVGVTLAVLAAGLVFLWRECSVARLAQGAPLSAKPPAPAGAHVLLVHLWPAERVAPLRAELLAAGLTVADYEEAELAALLRAMPAADVLATDRLSRAKLVFLCPERRPAAGGARHGRELPFGALLDCVRNSALAHDYRRVFVVLPEGAAAEAEPAALVPGCRFRWPADATELVRQLSVPLSAPDSERMV